MKKVVFVLLAMLFTLPAYSQVGFGSGMVLTSTGKPAGEAYISVCADSACSTLSTIYTDQTGVTPGPNPFQTDIYGNYGFYALSGQYWVKSQFGAAVNISKVSVPLDGTQRILGQRDVGTFSGADIGVKIANCLTALGNTRGTCNAMNLVPTWPTTAAMTGFTVLPGNTVVLGNGIYVASSTVTVMSGGRLIGQNGHINGQGTVIKAGDTMTGNVIDLSVTDYPVDWWHWGEVRDLKIDGNKTARALNGITTGHGIAYRVPAGEPSEVRNVQVNNAPQDGIYIGYDVGAPNTAATGNIEQVSTFGNGRYGFNWDNIGGSNRCVGCGTDDNGVAGFHVKGLSSLVLLLIQPKVESKVAGVNPQGAFLFEGASTSAGPMISLISPLYGGSAASTTQFIHIINFPVSVTSRDAWIDGSFITKVIQDDTGSFRDVDYSTSTGGHYPFAQSFPSWSTSYFLGTFSYGYPSAQTGLLRLSSNSSINWRNNVNSADIIGITKGTDDVVQLGGSSPGIKFGGDIRNGADSTMSINFRAGQTVDQSVSFQFKSFSGGTNYWALQTFANGTGFQFFDNINNKQIFSADFAGGSNIYSIHKAGGIIAFKTSAGVTSLSISDGGVTQINGGSNVVLRCTTAGALPVGALTVNSANCGASATTSLTIN